MGIEGLALIALVVGVPVVLFLLLIVLGRVEESFVEPGERAVVLADLVTSGREPEEVEEAAARLLERVAPGRARAEVR